MDRIILHCDCNSFFASVEMIHRPELRNVPMAVAGSSDMRHGIILAKNDIAKKFNVKTAEAIWQAKQKCPSLVLVPPRHGEYSRYSRMVNAIYLRYTELVEPFGIDESWLDVSGSVFRFGSGDAIADEIREAVKKETGLTVSVGVSFNKVFAKLGSDYKKPDATTVITRDNFKQIVYPLNASDMLFVGRKTSEKLNKLGIKTIGELAVFDEKQLELMLGKQGSMIYHYSRGEDDSPVLPYDYQSDIKSVGNGMTFKRDIKNEDEIKVGVYALCDSVASRMRKHGVRCTTLQVTLKDSDFRSTQRQAPLSRPTDIAKELSAAALEIIKNSRKPDESIRSITITGCNLVNESGVQQLSLIDDGCDEKTRQRYANLECTMDGIRSTFGRGAVSLGGTIENDIGVDK